MPPVGFEPAISASERPQTYALDRAATGTSIIRNLFIQIFQLTSDARKIHSNVSAMQYFSRLNIEVRKLWRNLWFILGILDGVLQNTGY